MVRVIFSFSLSDDPDQFPYFTTFRTQAVENFNLVSALSDLFASPCPFFSTHTDFFLSSSSTGAQRIHQVSMPSSSLL